MITHSLLLACSPDRAFEVFTKRIDDWWPEQRRHLQGTSVIRIESSGRFCEENEAGEIVELGLVRQWTPPSSLVFDFYPGTGIEAPTQATITFTEVGDKTLVEVVHRPTEASRSLFDAVAPRYQESWTLVFDAFNQALKSS